MPRTVVLSDRLLFALIALVSALALQRICASGFLKQTYCQCQHSAYPVPTISLQLTLSLTLYSTPIASSPHFPIWKLRVSHAFANALCSHCSGIKAHHYVWCFAMVFCQFCQKLILVKTLSVVGKLVSRSKRKKANLHFFTF